MRRPIVRTRAVRMLAASLAASLVACAPTADTSVAPGLASGTATVDATSTLEDFAGANGLSALPRDRVVLGEGDGALVIDALVADTPASRTRGLQGVAEVPEGLGMLFVFDEPSGPGGRPGFWMLDTLVPLDIAFLADGRVVGVATMTPCPGPPCPITHPGVDYDAALEVTAGTLGRAGVVPGDPSVWGPGAAG